jgi:hypothetical protein
LFVRRSPCRFLFRFFLSFLASTQLCLRAENFAAEKLSQLRRERNLREYVKNSMKVKVLGYKRFVARSTAIRGLSGKPSFVQRTKFPLGDDESRRLRAFKDSG